MTTEPPSPPAPANLPRKWLSKPHFKSHLGTGDVWLEAALQAARLASAAADTVPIVNNIFQGVAVILDTVQRIRTNKEDLEALCNMILQTQETLSDLIITHQESKRDALMRRCEEFQSLLGEIQQKLIVLLPKRKGLNHLRGFFLARKEKEEIAAHKKRLRDFAASIQLFATLETNFVIKADPANHVHSVLGPVTEIQNSPLPSRVFHGRAEILLHMHQYFKHQAASQKISDVFSMAWEASAKLKLH
ncbi:hypothetical protein MKEN_01160600 [Mycena kentingensis (nom. inval.)]|nr:hypothetical protein MKEN_01160600 [Mycena kentingensis (nom. inval.)]